MVRKGSRVQVPQRALSHALASAGACVVQRVFEHCGTVDRASSRCAGFLGGRPIGWEDAPAVNDLLPLLAFPLAYGWYFTSRRYERELHGALTNATAEPAPRPLLDAGPAPVLRVAASLTLPEAAAHAERPAARWRTGRRARLSAFSAFVAPLGLRLQPGATRRVRWRRQAPQAMRILGVRHSSHVEVLLGVDRQEVRIGTPGVVSYRVQGANGRLEASPDSALSVQTGLQALQPHRRWNQVGVTGGPGWVRVERCAHGAESWVHDLWLAEFVRDLALLATEAPASAPRRERALVGASAAGAGLAGRGQTAGG